MYIAGADMVNDVSAGKFDPLMLPTVGALPGVPFVAMHMRGDPQTMQQPQHLRYRIEHENKQQLKNKQEQEPGINIFSCAGSELDGQQQSTARRTPATALFASADPATAGYGAQVVQVVAGELAEQLAVVDAHIPRWLQLVDPGIGFAKGYDENTALLQPDQLRRFKELLGGRSMVVGFSRKKFINRVIGESKARRGLLDSEDAVAYSASVEEKDLATAVTCSNLVGVADIVRVHDVASTRTACDVQQAFK